MKKASFTGLLYRELYLLKKDYLTSLMIFFLFAALGWLIFLSMKYGNLGYFIGGYSEGSRHLLVSKDTSEALCVSAVLYLKLMPCLYSGSIIMVSANSAAKDIKLSAWPRFEHSTPLTPLRYASVKTVSAMFPVAVSFLLSLIYYCSISRALGEAFTYADLSVIAFFCAFMTLWSVLGRIMIGLLKNPDMGFLSASALLMTPIFVVAFLNSAKEKGEAGTEDASLFLSKAMLQVEKYSPLLFLVLVLSFVTLFLSMYFLYQRREK